MNRALHEFASVMGQLLRLAGGLALASACFSCAATGTAIDIDRLQNEVLATETAFAATMADRDFDAFRSYLAAEAVFVSGTTTLRGSDAVAAAWQRYFTTDEVPFSWKPELVVVLDSGALALSSGPVAIADGTVVGVFNSVWRRDANGRWRIVFDKGGCRCNPAD